METQKESSRRDRDRSARDEYRDNIKKDVERWKKEREERETVGDRGEGESNNTAVYCERVWLFTISTGVITFAPRHCK